MGGEGGSKGGVEKQAAAGSRYLPFKPFLFPTQEIPTHGRKMERGTK